MRQKRRVGADRRVGQHGHYLDRHRLVAGLIARFLSPGPNKPVGLLLTRDRGRLPRNFIGQAVGWYRADQGAGFISATLGAIAVLFIWNRLVVNQTIRDPGNPRVPPGPGQWFEWPHRRAAKE